MLMVATTYYNTLGVIQDNIPISVVRKSGVECNEIVSSQQKKVQNYHTMHMVKSISAKWLGKYLAVNLVNIMQRINRINGLIFFDVELLEGKIWEF